MQFVLLFVLACSYIRVKAVVSVHYVAITLWDLADYKYLVWLINHIVAICETAKASTATSRFGPVDDVCEGMLFAIVFSMNHATADAVHKNAP